MPLLSDFENGCPGIDSDRAIVTKLWRWCQHTFKVKTVKHMLPIMADTMFRPLRILSFWPWMLGAHRRKLLGDGKMRLILVADGGASRSCLCMKYRKRFGNAWPVLWRLRGNPLLYYGIFWVVTGFRRHVVGKAVQGVGALGGCALDSFTYAPGTSRPGQFFIAPSKKNLGAKCQARRWSFWGIFSNPRGTQTK